MFRRNVDTAILNLTKNFAHGTEYFKVNNRTCCVLLTSFILFDVAHGYKNKHSSFNRSNQIQFFIFISLDTCGCVFSGVQGPKEHASQEFLHDPPSVGKSACWSDFNHFDPYLYIKSDSFHSLFHLK